MDIVGSHQRLLVAAALRTEGPILELGCGWYSTPILHEIAEATKRPLLTLDNNNDWLQQFSAVKWPNDNYGFGTIGQHELRLVGWWGDVLIDIQRFGFASYRFGLCFVDNGQPAEREWLVRALMDRVDVFVMHDTEDGFPYGYDRLLGEVVRSSDGTPQRKRRGGMFKHQWTDGCQSAWTTVASNVVDVAAWGLRMLPPVDVPAEEVT